MPEIEYTVKTTHVVKQEGSTVELSRGTFASKHPLQSLAFVNVSDLVPGGWYDWFCDRLSNRDIWIGDCAFSIVSYTQFLDLCIMDLDYAAEWEEFDYGPVVVTEETYIKWLEILESDTDTQWVNLEA